MRWNGLSRLKRLRSQLFPWLVAGILGLVLGGCSSPVAERIHGAWEVLDATEPTRVEFTPCGAVTRTVAGFIAYEGRYRLMGGDRLEEEVGLMGETHVRLRRLKLTGDELNLSDGNGRLERLRRLR